MRPASFFRSTFAERTSRGGPRWIAAGLVILLTGACWPAVPVVTAMALVALGATKTVIARFRDSNALRSAIAAHLFAYASLYLLFLGAVCHAGMTGPEDGLTFLQGIDVGVSAGLMTVAARLGLAAMTGAENVAR